MARATLVTILAVAGATALIFTVAPHLDLAIALFFRDYQASAEAQDLKATFAILRNLNYHFTIITAGLPVIAIVAKLIWPRLPMLIRPRTAILLLVTLLIGPGLLVNGILKDQWSRPRPGEVTEFGGPLEFKPWYDPSGECRSNCSFVSGESASAFWLVTPAVVVPAPWTAPAVCGAVAYASVIAFTRVFTTGHFVTDTVFAASLVLLVVWFAYGLMFRWKATALSDAAIERWMERCARATWGPLIAAGNRLMRRNRDIDR